MKITRDEFLEFLEAQKIKISGNALEAGPLSRTRWSNTTLNINKYIYIYDHFEELKNKFGI